MDFGTTITDYNIALDGDHAREPSISPKPHRVSPSANTVGNEGRPIEALSGTDSLPESIWTSWGRIAQANMSVRMLGDLVRIAAAGDGWRGAGSRALRAGSLANFLEFWSLIRADAKEPELALAPDGSLHAEWFESQRRRLDVRFADKHVFFGLFSNNTIVEGVDDLKTVAQILRLHRAAPLKWSAR